MREIIEQAKQWRTQGEAIALATVVKTWGSAPRKVAAKMAITPSGQMAGSVSGGCVEGAVFEESVTALQSKKAKLIHYGVADETAWSVGLACGGQIDVFVQPFADDVQAQVAEWIEQEQSGAVVTVIAGSAELIGKQLTTTPAGRLTGSITPTIDQLVETQQADWFAQRKAQRVRVADETELFVDVIVPAPTLIIVGGVQIAIALVRMAEVVGFRPIVIDPRRAFGSAERFPDINLIQQWPRKALANLAIHPTTAVALLTHDPKIDDQALGIVLPSSAFYVGALGSRKTAAKRVARLQAAGFSEEMLGRIYGPIGLDINAQTPEEIALAIMGEIITAYRA